MEIISLLGSLFNSFLEFVWLSVDGLALVVAASKREERFS
jgi:hypothetical protein